MGSLKNIVRTTKDKLLQLQSGLAVSGHTFDADNLYFVELDFSKFLLGITLNGRWAESPSFYAPLSSGIAGLMLYSGGNGATPYWGDAPSGGSSGNGGITGVTFTSSTASSAHPLGVATSLLSNKVTAIPYMLYLKYPDLSLAHLDSLSSNTNFIVTEHNRANGSPTAYECCITLSNTITCKDSSGRILTFYPSLVILGGDLESSIAVRVNLSTDRQAQLWGRGDVFFELATLDYVSAEIGNALNSMELKLSNALNGVESRLEAI